MLFVKVYFKGTNRLTEGTEVVNFSVDLGSAASVWAGVELLRDSVHAINESNL